MSNYIVGVNFRDDKGNLVSDAQFNLLNTEIRSMGDLIRGKIAMSFVYRMGD